MNRDLCSHNHNVTITKSGRVLTEVEIVNGELEFVSAGDEQAIGYTIQCKDCGQADYYPAKRTPKWLLRLYGGKGE